MHSIQLSSIFTVILSGLVLNADALFTKDHEDWCVVGRQQHMTFDKNGCDSKMCLPKTKPDHFWDYGLRFQNIVRAKFDEVVGKDILPLPKGAPVGILGGMVDAQGVTQDYSTAYISIKPSETTQNFDLRSFTFACVQDKKPVDCTIGVRTSNGTEMGAQEPMLFSYRPGDSTIEHPMKKAEIDGERGEGLKIAAFGLPVGRQDSCGKVIPNFKLHNLFDKDMNSDKMTVYVDDIVLVQHHCPKMDKTAKFPFGAKFDRLENGTLPRDFEAFQS
ncbi:MAG: hypothetical protein M1828_006486 [Chrysothrix sp. TS-e1954]|nr:MAG: hypothetical protein M1828_006486 [Chrysothrix sp. TS-e1954]